jgi:hypothetical protein
MNVAISAMRSFDQPEVPTTIGMPAPVANSTMAALAPGCVTRVECRVQLEVVGLFDEPKRQPTHLARGSGHGDPYRHVLHPSKAAAVHRLGEPGRNRLERCCSEKST